MKRNMLKFVVTVALILAMAAPAFAARKTRDLVFEEDDEAEVTAKAQEANIENPQAITVKTTLDLTRDGETTSVSPTYEFQSGDRVKLRYSTNSDGYVYWMAKMSSGKYTMLFPSEQTGTDNFITKNSEYTVPVKGSFRFDDTPGTEHLLMVFSPDRIPEMEQAVAEAAGNKGQVQDNNAVQVAAVEEQSTNKRKTRDLVFEEEEEEEILTKSQVAPKGEPFVASYELFHK